MYSISYQSINDYPDLESTWRDLETRGKYSVFLSWSWIKHMSSFNPELLKVLSVKVQDKVLGLCLFCIKEVQLSPILTIKQCYINRYGIDELDQIWIENNDFLVDSSQEIAIKNAMLEYFFVNKLADEVILGMSDTKSISELNKPSSLNIKTRSLIQSQGFLTDLCQCGSLEQYLATLSKNTRSQIKRSHKLLSESGKLALHEAGSVSEKLEFLELAGQIHRERWADTEFGTGFNNPYFVDFHKHLISDPAQPRATSIFRLSLDSTVLGYIYILIEDNKWLFYLSAINFHHDNRIKLGLVFHSLVIEQAIKNKISYYDFLAGTARYKKSLSNVPHYEQDLICFYKNTFTLGMINMGRRVKHKLKMILIALSNKIPHRQVE